MPPVNLLLKPASGNCNLRCRYCFYYDITRNREQASYGFMSEETLEQVIKKALAFAEGSCTIAFQGGEPTLRGLDFFKKALAFEQKWNQKQLTISNALQTNGYQLTEEWARFFAENHFLVGISLDGHKDSHNLCRRTSEGKETFFDILHTIDLFRLHQVDFNVLTVVNHYNSRKAKRMYQFFKKNNLSYLQFIPCLDPLQEAPGGHDYSLSPEDYGIFLKELFDLWYEDLLTGQQPYIRQFENYIGLLLGQPPEACDQCGVCNYQYVVEADGEVYPCDFYVLDEYRLGNLNEVSFSRIDEKREQTGFLAYSRQDHQKCRDCPYYAICRGGCRRHRLSVDADGDHLNYFCSAYRSFFDYTLDRMIQIARMLTPPAAES